jgi:hypothetical protein
MKWRDSSNNISPDLPDDYGPARESFFVLRQPAKDLMNVLPILAAFLLLVHQDAAASDLSLAGTWSIVSGTPAPWVIDEGQRKTAEASGKRLLKLELKFAAKEVISKDRVLGCKGAVYEPTTYPVDALFQGMLPEPNQERLALDMGFKRGEVPGSTCAAAAGCSRITSSTATPPCSRSTT